MTEKLSDVYPKGIYPTAVQLRNPLQLWYIQCKEKTQLRFQKRKIPTVDFLISISSLDILKMLLHQCRS